LPCPQPSPPDFGAFSPWLFPLVALGALFVIVPFSRTVAAFPESGGPAAYGRVFGRVAGFELGWIYYASRAAAFAANANVLIAYLGRWAPAVEEGFARAGALAGLCAGLALINILGIERAMRLLAGLTFVKALHWPLAAIATLLLFGPIPAPWCSAAIVGVRSRRAAGVLRVRRVRKFGRAAGETRRPATPCRARSY
jgi:amino acid transporter